MAGNPIISITTAERLVNDDSASVRKTLVQNPTVDGEVLKMLANDKNVEIKKIAEERMVKNEPDKKDISKFLLHSV